MSDFDQIKALLAPQCPQLTARELNDLVCDVFVAIVWAYLATGMVKMGLHPAHPPCEQLCQ